MKSDLPVDSAALLGRVAMSLLITTFAHLPESAVAIIRAVIEREACKPSVVCTARGWGRGVFHNTLFANMI